MQKIFNNTDKRCAEKAIAIALRCNKNEYLHSMDYERVLKKSRQYLDGKCPRNEWAQEFKALKEISFPRETEESRFYNKVLDACYGVAFPGNGARALIDVL